MTNSLGKIIPITALRRNFGRVTKDLAEIESIVLTKGGEPFAVLKAAPEVKRKVLKKAAGAWKGTELDDDKIWKEVFKRKSRKGQITL